MRRLDKKMSPDFESWFQNFDPWQKVDPFMDVDPDKIKGYLQAAFEAGEDRGWDECIEGGG